MNLSNKYNCYRHIPRISYYKLGRGVSVRVADINKDFISDSSVRAPKQSKVGTVVHISDRVHNCSKLNRKTGNCFALSGAKCPTKGYRPRVTNDDLTGSYSLCMCILTDPKTGFVYRFEESDKEEEGNEHR